MADADQQVNSQATGASADVTGLKTEVNQTLGEMKSQMQALKDSFQDSMNQLATILKPPAPAVNTSITDTDLFDPNAINQKVEQTASRIATQMMDKERAMNTTVYNMAQEYPEIQNTLRASVLEEHQKLAPTLRNTPEGYEIAVLKAASKAGVLPKSKRTDDGVTDADFSAPGSRGNGPDARKRGASKVDPRSVEFARLLGQDVDDPAYLKRLEEASQRTEYGKYK